jgi:hypothetical protein
VETAQQQQRRHPLVRRLSVALKRVVVGMISVAAIIDDFIVYGRAPGESTLTGAREHFSYHRFADDS